VEPDLQLAHEANLALTDVEQLGNPQQIRESAASTVTPMRQCLRWKNCVDQQGAPYRKNL
jgi:hypothetical protein